MLALALTAELEGVTDLAPLDSADEPYYYMFKVQCTSCRETHPNYVGVSRFESNDVPGSKGEANFVWRCQNCKRQHTANIASSPAPYASSDPPKRQTIITIDCRGLEFLDFRPEGTWTAKGADSGTKFTDVDLTQGEWFDYDEKAAEEVAVKELKFEIVRA